MRKIEGQKLQNTYRLLDVKQYEEKNSIESSLFDATADVSHASKIIWKRSLPDKASQTSSLSFNKELWK